MKHRKLFILLITVSLFLSASCGAEPSVKPDGTDTGQEGGGEEKFPRTAAAFTYEDLYAGTVPSAGNVTVMVIPVYWEDGGAFDEAYAACVEERFYRTPSDGHVPCVRDYYRNASFGKLEAGFEIMDIFRTGAGYDEYTASPWNFGNVVRDAYENALENVEGDLSRFDADGDGYADAVVFLHNSENPNHAAYSHEMTPEELEGFSAFPLRVSRYAICFYSQMAYVPDVRDTTVIHELAHLFGIRDYYDLYGEESFITRFDLQEGGAGDWNSFSKYAVGWIDPFVITEDTEKVTLTLRAGCQYPDAVLIPSTAGWNGTPFDEYLLIDVFAGKGNNAAPWECYADVTAPNPDGGVRILHVDARYVYSDVYTNESFGWVDPDEYDEGALRPVRGAYSNCSGAYDPSPEPDPDYRLLQMIPCRGEITMDYRFDPGTLFGEGDVFTMEEYAGYFPNGTELNHGGTVPFRITVESYDPVNAEAVVTFEKTE